MKRFVRQALIACGLWALIFYSNTEAAELTMLSAVQKAGQNAWDVQIHNQEQVSKNWEEKNALANYLPKVNYELTWMMMDDETVKRANGGYDMMMQAIMPPGASIPENPQQIYENSFSHKISINQPLFNGGVELVAIDIAKKTQRAFKLQGQSLQNDVQLNVVKGYLDWVGAMASSETMRKTFQWLQDNLEREKLKVELGTSTRTNILNWENEILQAQNDLVQIQNGGELTLRALYQAMGEEIQSMGVEPEAFAKFEAQAKSRAELPNVDAGENLQIKTLRAWTETAEGSVKVARSSYFPSLNAFGEVSWPADDELAPKNDQRGWTAGVVLSVPVFTGFRNTTKYREAKADYRKTVIEQKKNESLIRLGQQKMLLDYKGALASLDASEKQMALMEENLTLMQSRYEGGLVSQLELSEIARALEQVRLGYIQSVITVEKIKAEYLHSLGKLEVQ